MEASKKSKRWTAGDFFWEAISNGVLLIFVVALLRGLDFPPVGPGLLRIFLWVYMGGLGLKVIVGLMMAVGKSIGAFDD